ncbi:unnamed protein product [Didymodactylos carnosus]|uniref:Uncharacterized protein n=1 Tax=Didymodactylos carnosus TaxID=1234261 RepID=A0A8S2JC60_9BILA|nr:unnamed protein product [Didymodactylos carnosus]CAF3804366.1 unnamed protein product [Didymodactylos carnosus]
MIPFPQLQRDDYLHYDAEPAKPNIQPVQCYKYCKFGHPAEYCKNVEICNKCSGPHEANICTSTDVKCINCGEQHMTTPKQSTKYQRGNHHNSNNNEMIEELIEKMTYTIVHALSSAMQHMVTSIVSMKMHRQQIPPLLPSTLPVNLVTSRRGETMPPPIQGETQAITTQIQPDPP